jgi:uncharacterized protein YpmB
MKVLKTLLALTAVFALALAVNAADKDKDKDKDKPDDKPVTLKGTITCAKCDLKLADECATVIKAKNDDGKDVVYWLKDKGNGEKYHEKVCQGPSKGSVTGVVSKDKDGKMWITPSKDGVKYD